MSNKLTARENELYGYFGLYDVDVPIAEMHDKLYPEGDTDGRTPQQRLGALISRINKKLTGERIVPGNLKRTYRLTRQSV